ncbi:MAG: SDR family oxidoreductase [Deltaproteobacteria bacterium]|nr:SDR family oxidoreductase [Deltaproteobacteria bacterium]
MKLDGKVAVVTGGAQGIGKGIALKLAERGAEVVIADCNESIAEQTALEIGKIGRRAIVCKTDVSDDSQCQTLAARALEAFGQIDILVNNAGWDRFEFFVDNSPDTWDRLLGINLKGPIYCAHTILKTAMIPNNGGRIINIASDAGRVGSMGEVVYSATKGGVIAFSKALAREVARYHVTVNVICPGPTETALLGEMKKSERGAKVMAAIEKSIPLGRTGTPQDIASAVAFLASDEASFITGQVLSVSGGLTMAG